MKPPIPKNTLGLIALFLAVVELAFAYPITILSGTLQIILMTFMVSYPIIVLLVFILIIIKYPDVLYSPGEYGQPKLYVDLIRSRHDRNKKLNNDFPPESFSRIQNEIKSLTETIKGINSNTNKNDKDYEIIKQQLSNLITSIEKVELSFNESLFIKRVLYMQHSFWGISDIRFDPKSIQDTCSLDTLVEAALYAIEKNRNDLSKQNEIKGEISLQEPFSDFIRVFEYTINGKYNKYMFIKETNIHTTMC